MIVCLAVVMSGPSGQLAFSGGQSPTGGENPASAISRRLEAARAISEPYQEEALDALIREANDIARDLSLPGEVPITRTNLVEVFILPRQGSQSWKALGKIATRNYVYYASKANKFCYLERTHSEAQVAKWKRDYLWPISRIDTNGAYQMATQWLAAVSIDVQALNRDCKLRIQALTSQGRKQGARFLPIYTVYWVEGAEGHGSAASVQLFAPTQTLLHLRVEDPKYNLRRPLLVK